MRPLITLVRREFTAYFLSPVAYVVMAVFLLLTGLQFAATVGALTETGPRGVEYPLQGLLGSGLLLPFLFLLIPPLLTMRLLAEERGTGTLEMLLTAPVRDWQVVAGKYLGSFLFYCVLWLPTLLYVPVLVDLDWSTFQARIDPWPVLTTAVGVLAAGAMFLAIGLFVSSLVRSQLVAALISVLIGLAFIASPTGLLVLAGAGPNASAVAADSGLSRLLAFFSVPYHFSRDFTRGVIDTRHLVLYASVAGLCLFLTNVSLEQRRLRA